MDTDFYTLLADVGPDGATYGLQRGMLRASHREVDEGRADYATVDGKRLLIRSHHPHARAAVLEHCSPRIDGELVEPPISGVVRGGIPSIDRAVGPFCFFNLRGRCDVDLLSSGGFRFHASLN